MAHNVAEDSKSEENSMKTLLTILLAAVVFMGCGAYRKTKFDVEKRFEPNEFSAYIDVFEEDAHSQGQAIIIDNLIIRFGTIQNTRQKKGTDIAGVCYYNSIPLIIVNQDVWDNLSEAEKRALLYHEMGHCVLMRDHIPAEDKLSIMNPTLLKDNVVNDNYNYLMEELFDKVYYGSRYDFTLHEGDDCGGTIMDARHPSRIHSDSSL